MEIEAAERLEGWLRAADRARDGGFEDIGDLDELPGHVRSDSEFWCDEILSAAANPHDLPGVRHRICRGGGARPDLLSHEASSGELRFTVVEGRNFMLVRVDPRSLDVLSIPEAERPAAIARAAGALFKAPLGFQTCAPIGEGGMVCTDEGIDPLTLASWAERAECGIRDGELWFVCYKRRPQRTGFGNAAQWFADTGEVRPDASRGRARRRRRTGG